MLIYFRHLFASIMDNFGFDWGEEDFIPDEFVDDGPFGVPVDFDFDILSLNPYR